LKKKLLPLAKTLWLVLLLLGVVFYVSRNADSLRVELRAFSITSLLLAFFCLLAGKLLLAELTRASVRVVGWQALYSRLVYINSISQLAKYLPGGIWHFIGKAGYYRADGLALDKTTKAMILENVWLVASSFMAGLLYYALYFLDATVIIVIAGIFILWISVLWLLNRVGGFVSAPRVLLRLLGLQWVTWSLIGLSMALLMPSAHEPRVLALGVGAFCLSWGIGYLTIFAPGGIGVREVVLTALLAVAISPESAIMYGSVNRLVWVITELFLGFIVAPIIARRRVPMPE
jgi:uncharacterized membrane protein YbhN (UPF0104 family)